ncbi:hypothetical protein RND81_14G029900 [Saponaria officinalis]|uniref:Inositol-tetrakisphosphate 1-kinase n=1 Tax=Saponaria officinalis TaxID=3572 RepID=A0AAW1GMM8_SAPOF
MAESDTMFKVGYALKPGKVGSLIQPSLVTLCKQRGIDLVQVDLGRPLVEQGPFECVVHKLYTPEWKRELEDFQSKYPNAVVVDSPSAIERLHNRVTMLEVVNNITMPYIGTPRQVVAYDEACLVSDNSLALKFPVIAKPLLANGNEVSHEMCLVFESSGLHKLKPPVVLQEFVNHGGVLFKVYVAGDHVKCVKRTSLPDVSDRQLKDGNSIMPFSQISSLDAPAGAEQQEETPLEFIHKVAKGLRDATKLHLFNFDMIKGVNESDGNNKYLIIDINYFPGYAKVTGFENMLTDFFWDVITRNQLPCTADSETTAEVTHVL